MKASEYLWKYIDIQHQMEGEPPEEAQGELRKEMTRTGDIQIVSDTTGEAMSEREARSVLGRNEEDLRTLYLEGNRAKFDALVLEQLGSDDAYHAAKAEDGDAGEDEVKAAEKELDQVAAARCDGCRTEAFDISIAIEDDILEDLVGEFAFDQCC